MQRFEIHGTRAVLLVSSTVFVDYPTRFEYAGLSVPDSLRCTLSNFNGSSLSMKRAENGPGSSSGSGYVNTLIARMYTAYRDEARSTKHTEHALVINYRPFYYQHEKYRRTPIGFPAKRRTSFPASAN